MYPLIYGIGHDVLEIERVADLLEGRLGGRFTRRVLTGSELALAASRGGLTAEYTAGRFAAKEAVAKAFGCGIGASLGFVDIEILPGGLGRPDAVIADAAWKRLNLPEGAAYAIHLTITHTRGLASAFAIVERRGET